MFEDLVESYYLDSQIKDDFQCDQDCYTQYSELTKDDHPNICTHDYQHIAQNIDDLSDNTQQNNLYSSKESTSSFTDDIDMHCDYSISNHTPDTENANDTHMNFVPKYPAIHSQQKHTYRDTFGDAHIQYHDFDNQDLLTFKDKYTVTKINQVPYQTIEYNDNSMFTAKLMNDTPIEIFIDNGATPSILPLCTYNSPFYTHILKLKATLLYIQEEV